MERRTLRGIPLAAALMTTMGMILGAGTATADDGPAATGPIEEIVVSGLRGAPRSSTDSAVPIDVFNAQAIESVSHVDTHDILQTLVPSYNVSRQPISDGATFIRPALLRGLPSHHTLVLVNGKRRHRASLVTIGGSGTQGPDVATIPSSAIQSIEVLRDGAAAQYGSDAIAGVINFNLKDNNEGFSIGFDTGQHFESDGLQKTVQGNLGLPIGSQGFLSLSAEWNDTEFTERAEQYCESWFCVDPDSPRFNPAASYATRYMNDPAFVAGLDRASLAGGDVVQTWGQPDVDSVRMFANAGYDFANGMELYAFGNYSESSGSGDFFYRYPGNGTIEDLRLQDGSIWNPLAFFPGGFTPRFEGEVTDYSGAVGIRGLVGGDISYDLSARYDYSEIAYTLKNTLNPSLGPDSPTAFKPGDLTNEEMQLQIDLVKEFDVGLSTPLVLAFGLSYLDEAYEVVQSKDPASYVAGSFALRDPFGFCSSEAAIGDRTPTSAGAAVIAQGSTLNCASSADPVYRVVGVGSNGFPGYSPEFADDYTRDSLGAYVDLSVDLTDALFAQVAVRHEDYSDFGSETVGKVASRYRINDTFALRASVGSGFRAPTPGQQGTTNVSTRLPDGFPVATGLFPAASPVALALGAKPLKAETSINYTLGMTADFAELSLTVDFYRIDIDDRLYSVSTLPVSTTPGSPGYANYLALAGAGVAGAESIGGVFYFTNAFDSKTEGVDVVATFPFPWSNGQVTSMTAAMNYNRSELASDASRFLNAEDRFDFENLEPKLRGVLTGVHNFGDFSITGRASYFGSSEDANGGQAQFVQKYSATTFFDLEGSYSFNDNVRVTVGGRNIFDAYPDKTNRDLSQNDYCCGRTYGSASLVPWQGGYYFMRLNADF